MKIEVSNGEIVDKVTILRIKASYNKDPIKAENISKELNYLEPLLAQIATDRDLVLSLTAVNKELWFVEDELRRLEGRQDFADYFIKLARSVYILNDERAELKKKINKETGSNFIEEKVLPEYRKIRSPNV